MVDLKNAIALAKGCWDEVNYCRETENAYIFGKKGDTDIGGSGPVVVLKETGECLNMPAYICEGLSTPTIREMSI